MPPSTAEHIEIFAKEMEQDYVSLSDLIEAAHDASDADLHLSRMRRTLNLLRQMLERGFRAVDLKADGDCTPWPDQSPAAVLKRIEDAWLRSGDEGELGYMFWFDLPSVPRHRLPRS